MENTYEFIKKYPLSISSFLTYQGIKFYGLNYTNYNLNTFHIYQATHEIRVGFPRFNYYSQLYQFRRPFLLIGGTEILYKNKKEIYNQFSHHPLSLTSLGVFGIPKLYDWLKMSDFVFDLFTFFRK
jgi:hypothetical protein